MAHDTWARRRQGLPPLTPTEITGSFRENQQKQGFKQKTLMIPQSVIKTVEKHAKQRNTTQRVVWDEVLRAGIAALNLQK